MRIHLSPGFLLLAGVFFGQGCGSDGDNVNCDLEGPDLSLLATDPTPCGENGGSLEVMATGGQGEIQYSIEGGAFGTSNLFGNLGEGRYVVTARDENGCEDQLEVKVNSDSDLLISATTVDSGCGESNGAITLSASGGQGNYEFRISGQGFSSSNSFTGMAQGLYDLTVRDELDCTFTLEVQVESGIAFNTIESIIETNCAQSNCHGGSQSPDFRNATNIRENAANIRRRAVEVKDMPPASSGRTVEQSDLDLIKCWADDVAPD